MTNKDDLISREALKIEIEKQIAYCDDKAKHQSDMEEVLRYSNTSYGLRLAHNYIDNAPTVAINCKDCDGYEAGYSAGLNDAERSQGEWIDHSEDYGYVECPFCHELTNCDGNKDELHYCWHCGAKLGKGGAE